MSINTYPKMNETIKDLLRRGEEPMGKYILARIEELEKERADLLESHHETCEACGFNFECRYDYCGAYKWRALWAGLEPPEEPITRFAKIRACKSPEAMALELNKNGRHFCPEAYTKKESQCTKPCGKCITDWLEEKDHEKTDNG